MHEHRFKNPPEPVFVPVRVSRCNTCTCVYTSCGRRVCACVQVTGQMVVRLGISPKASNHINERTAITIRSAVLLQLYLFTFLFTSTIQAMKLNMLIFSKKLNALLLVP